MLTTENPDNEIEKHTNKPLKWQCYSQCKPLTIAEVNAIVTLNLCSCYSTHFKFIFKNVMVILIFFNKTIFI